MVMTSMRARKRRSLTTTELTGVQIAAAVALGALPALTRAAEPDVLEEDFLEYLTEFDDEKDDWSWFDRGDKATITRDTGKKEPERSAIKAQKEKP